MFFGVGDVQLPEPQNKAIPCQLRGVVFWFPHFLSYIFDHIWSDYFWKLFCWCDDSWTFLFFGDGSLIFHATRLNCKLFFTSLLWVVFLCAWKFMLAQKTSSRSPLALEAMSGGWFRRSDRFGAGVDGLCRKSPFVGKYQRTSRHWRLFLPKTLEDIWILTQQGLVMIEFENECTTGRLTCPSVNFNIFQPYSWTPRPYSWHVNDGKCCCSVSPPLSPQNHEWFCGKSMIELDPCVCALCLDLIVR